MEPAKFQKIVAVIPYCDFNEFHQKFKAEQNVHLKAIMNHGKCKNKQIQYFKLSDLGQFDRVVTIDPTLWKLVHNDRKTAHAATVTRLTPAVMAGLPNPGTDHIVFFKIVLSDMRLPYESEGAALVTNIRNNYQHLVESHSLDRHLNHQSYCSSTIR